MSGIIRESLNITNKYIVLATPLILFSLISSLYLFFSIGGTSTGLIIAVFLFFLMLGAFLSGWLHLVKRVVKNPSEEDVNAILSDFPTGVGEYFLPVLGMILKTLVFALIIFICSYFIGMKTIGDIGIAQESLSSAMTSMESLKAFLAELTTEQLTKLNYWNLLYMITMGMTYFLIMFYSPVLFFKTKNPFIAFFINIKDLFARKFFTNLMMYLSIFFAYFFLMILTTVFGTNVFAHFIFTLANFYFATFIVILVFNYYYSNYIKIGSNIDKTI